MRYQGQEMHWSRAVAEVVDQVFYATHPGKNAFWDDVADLPEPRLPSREEVKAHDISAARVPASRAPKGRAAGRDPRRDPGGRGVLRRPRTTRHLVDGDGGAAPNAAPPET